MILLKSFHVRQEDLQQERLKIEGSHDIIVKKKENCMRSRYVSKCKCKKSPIVSKELGILKKGVLDIEVSVKCSICGKPYNEVGPKRSRMIDSKIVKEAIDIPEEPTVEIYNGPENTGNFDQENKSTDGSILEEEQTGSEQTEEKIEDPEIQRDEGSQENQVKDKKTFKERFLGKGNKPLPDRTTDEALEDNGVPKEDLW